MTDGVAVALAMTVVPAIVPTARDFFHRGLVPLALRLVARLTFGIAQQLAGVDFGLMTFDLRLDLFEMI